MANAMKSVTATPCMWVKVQKKLSLPVLIPPLRQSFITIVHPRIRRIPPKVTPDEVSPVTLGDNLTSNRRTINKYFVPDVLETCQLSMGLTELAPGNLWNTMPCHTHERRMEVYFYFNMDDDACVFHMMGQPQETRHIVMHNEQAVISPSLVDSFRRRNQSLYLYLGHGR